MTKYSIKTADGVRQIEAVTFVEGSTLRFVGEKGETVAIFTSFDWMVVVPAEDGPSETDTSSTETPVLSGEK